MLLDSFLKKYKLVTTPLAAVYIIFLLFRVNLAMKICESYFSVLQGSCADNQFAFCSLRDLITYNSAKSKIAGND